MKSLMLIFGLFFLTNSFCQEETESENPITFEVIEAGILRVFPEAYQQFLTVSFIRTTNFILPETASFLVPDKYFKKKLDQKELDKRAELLLEQLELLPACFSISFGEAEEYSWAAWEDKKVRKVTLTFGIGC